MSIGLITRRLGAVQADLKNKFQNLYCRRDFEEVIAELYAVGQKSGRDSILARLFDMFCASGIEFKPGMDNEYYEELVKSTNLPDFYDLEKEVLSFLFSKYRSYPTPEEYMQRITDNLSKDSKYRNDPLRLIILKRFVEYGNYLNDAGFGGKGVIVKYVKEKTKHTPTTDEILTFLDDGVFNGLESADKAQKKPKGKYGLLKLCDDLACGKFRTGGNTKKGLYLFAMAFNMTYCPASNSSLYNPETDIEKNLFRDYYCNNLMRFITDSYKGKHCEYDMNPTGQGINYKNFAEMIYIYYIASSHTPEEKIALSSRMIERVEKEKTANKSAKSNGDTLYFRRLYTEDILEKDEESFLQFILDNYNFDEPGSSAEISSITVSAQQETAYRNYLKIINELNCELEAAGTSLEGCNYGLWFTDVAQFKKSGYESIKSLNPNADNASIEDFLELLLAVNDYLGYTVNEKTSTGDGSSEHTKLSSGKTKALYIESAKDITRTALLVAYYYYYNIRKENSSITKSKSFEDVFADFASGVDKYLEASFFQKLSTKNIFDMMVVFSSYAYLNL